MDLKYRDRGSEYVDTKKHYEDDLTMVWFIISGCVFVIMMIITITLIRQHHFTI